MSTIQERLERMKRGEGQPGAAPASESRSVAERLNAMQHDANYDTLPDDINRFTKQIIDDIGVQRRTYQTPDMLDAYTNTINERINNLTGRIQDARSYYRNNRAAVESMYGKATADALLSALDEQEQFLAGVQTDWDAERSWWSQFADQADFDAWRTMENYRELAERPDFAQQSAYTSDRTDYDPKSVPLYKRVDYAKQWNYPLYEAINGNAEAQDVITATAMNNYGGAMNPLGALYGGMAENKAEAREMTEDEIAIFNYLYHTQGRDAAQAYYDTIQSDLNARRRVTESADWKKYAAEHPGEASALSVIMSPLRGVSYLGQLTDLADDGSIDQNAGYNRFTTVPGDIRAGVSEKIENGGKWGKAGSFLYQTGMSMADFLLATLITGGFAGEAAAVNVGSKAVNVAQGLSLAIMGTGAAADTVITAKERGLSDKQAFALGTIAGAAEVLTEKFSIEALLDKSALTKSAAGYFLKNVLAEGSEEVGSDIINLLADVLISKDKSEWKTAMRQLQEENPELDEKGAFWRVLMDQAQQMGLDFLGGAISGGGLAGASIAVNAAANYRGQMQTKQTNKSIDAAYDAMSKYGMFSPEARTAANEARQKTKRRADGYYGLALPTADEYEAERAKSAGTWFLELGDEAVRGVVDTGMESAEGTESRTLAEALNKKLEAGETPTAEELGRLYRANIVAIEAEEAAGTQPEPVQQTTAQTQAAQTQVQPTAQITQPTQTQPATAQPVQQPTIQPETQQAARAELLWTAPKDNGGWKAQYNGDIPIADALEITNPELFTAFQAEGTEGNTNTPIIDAYVSAYNDVRQGTISPMAAAQLMSDAYRSGGTGALRELYNPQTGNLTSEAVNTARQIDAQHAAQVSPAVAQNEQIPQAAPAGTQNDMNGGIANAGSGVAGTRPAGAPDGGGAGILGGGQGRVSGEGAGEQTGRQSAGARLRGLAGQSQTAVDRRADAKALPEVSAAELGVGRGTEDKGNRVKPRETWDEEMRSEAEKIKARTGYEVVYVLGGIKFRQKDGGIGTARGVFTGQRIIIQCDHGSATVTQLGDHELYHALSQHAPGMNEALRRQIISQFSEEQMEKVLGVYVSKLYGVYDITEGMADQEYEDAMNRILEELLADAYAGINAFGANTSVFQDAARAGVGQYWGFNDETAAATDRTTGPPDRYSYAGRNANGANSETLETAERMEMQGVDAEDIRQETGWFRGADGLWRYEIDDSGMEYRRQGDAAYMNDPEYREYLDLWDKAVVRLEASEEELERMRELDQKYKGVVPVSMYKLANGGATLGDIIQHDELFRAYPQLRNTGVQFTDLPRGTRGEYDRSENLIRLSNELRNAPEDTLIHEIQHAIQKAEGFARGSSTEYWTGKLTEERKTWLDEADARVRDAFDAMPEDVKNKVREMNRANISQDYDTAARIEEELYAEGYGDMLSAYQDAVFDRANEQQRQAEHDVRDEAYGLYRNTAGEIEARDAASRRTMTPEQRRATKPDTGNNATVFADDEDAGYFMSDEDGDTVKKQLQRAQDMLNAEPVAATIQSSGRNGRTNDQIKKDLTKAWAARGFHVDTKELGRVDVEEKQLNRSVDYMNTDAEIAAYEALFHVLKRGKRIDGHIDHDHRGYDTVTIAAPVILNGERGNMAVVVKQTKGNRYKVHRILTPDGKTFVLPTKANAGPTTAGGVTQSAYLRGVVTPAIDSASEQSVAQSGENVKGRYSVDDSAYMEAVDSGDMETAQRMVDEAAERAMPESKVRTPDGKLMPIYHGTKSDFTVFDTKGHGGANGTAEGYGIYLTDMPIVASAYGDRKIAGYADVKRPAYGDRKTIKRSELARLVKAICMQEAQRMVAEDDYASVKEALPDTWVSNYVYTPDHPSMSAVYSDVADHLLRQEDNDADVVYEIMNALGIRDYERAMDFYHDILTPTTGIDGIWQKWKVGKQGADANIILAFSSDQIKSNEPVTYDDAGNVIPLSERFNRETLDIRYSVDDEAEQYNQTAILTEDTVDKYLKDYAAPNSPEYAQAYITRMRPSQFVRLTTSPAGRLRVEAESGDLRLPEFTDATRDQPLQLRINTETGEIEGHEGRHRAVALDRAGVRSVPVLLFDSGNKYSKAPMAELELHGQDFGNGNRSLLTATVRDVLPLNYANRDEIIQRYTKQPSLERMQERYSNRPTVRYSVDDEQERIPQSSAEYAWMQQQAAKPETVKRVTQPVAESRPTIAKQQLRQNLLGLFSIPEGQRAEIGSIIDSYADRIWKHGALTQEDMDAFFDRMYAEGVMTVPADEYARAGRAVVAGGRVFVPDRVKSEFGDDWANFRRRAFAAGIYLTSNNTDSAADQWNAQLSESFPGIFDPNDLDERGILEKIVQMAEDGKDQKMSLGEYAAMLAGQEYVSEDEILDNMERQMDWALRTYAEKAALEVRLRDRTGTKIAQEREKAVQQTARQKAQEAQRRAKERDRRKELTKRQQENRELKDLQQKTLKQLQWISKNRQRAPADLRAAFDEVLGDIDIIAVSAANEMHWSNKYQATWRDLADMYKAARANDPNFLPSKELQQIVDRLDKEKIAEMDPGALANLYKMAVGLRTEFYNRNNVINDEEQRAFADLYTGIKDEMAKVKGGYDDGVGSKLFNDLQLTPMNAMLRMGGWNKAGQFYSVARMLEQGERDMRRFVVNANAELAPFLTENAEWVKRADGQGKDAIWYELEVPELLELGMGDKPIFGNTVKVYMTPAQKVHMYLESKNYDNLRHMAGGRTFADKELYSKGKRSEAFAQGRTVKLAPETVKKIVSDLTPEEMELARVLEHFYNEYSKGEINRVSNALYGYDKAIGGNYAPIVTNQNYVKSEPGVFNLTAEGVGNLKARQYSKNPSYNISAFDAFERSTDQTARFVGMAIPARNVNTLMNWRESNNSMRDILTHKWGADSTKLIDDLLTELQGGKEVKRPELDAAVNKALSKYIQAVFGFNPSIVLKQFASYPLAAAYLGYENMPKWVPGAAQVDTELIRKYSGELAYRTLGYATPETALLKDNPGKLEERGPLNFLFGGGSITWMDGFTVRTLWTWAENKVKNETELRPGTQEQIDAGTDPYYKAVAKEFEEAVSRSQPMYDTMHRSEVMRNSGSLGRAFTLFKTVPQQEYNMLREAFGELQYAKQSKADKATVKAAQKKVGRAVSGIMIGNLMIGAITFLNAMLKNKGKKYRDDEGNMTVESFMEQFGKQYFSDSAGLVLGGDVASDILGNIFAGDKWYDLDAPGIEQVNELIQNLVLKPGNTMAKLLSDSVEVLHNKGSWGQYMADHSDEYIKAVDEIATAAGKYLAGLPTDNVKGYLLGALSWVSPKIKTAYEDAMNGADKTGLKGLTGPALELRVEHLLGEHGVKASDETAAALAGLYEAGQKSAVPTDAPTSVTFDKEDHKLNLAQQQTWDAVWSGTVSGNIDELTASPAFQAADAETQAKMLDKLYDYAAEKAKAALFDDYEPSSSTQMTERMVELGASTADVMEARAILADEDKMAEKVEALRAADLSDVAKGAAYYGLLASDKERETLDELGAEAAASNGALTNALLTIKEASNDDDLKGAAKSTEKRNAIANSGLNDTQKAILYRRYISDTRDDDIAAFRAAGLSFNQFLNVQNEYAAINELDLSAGEKATEFSRWVNNQHFTDKQAEVIKDSFKYYSQVPQEAKRYEKLLDAGLSDKDAYDTTKTLKELKPEDGKDDVSQMQQLRAVAGADLNVKDKVAAVGTIMGTEMTTDSGNPSQYAKMLTMLDKGMTLDQFLDLKEAEQIDGYLRYLNAEGGRNYGISPEAFIEYRTAIKGADTDESGSVSKAEAAEAIREMGKGLATLTGSGAALTNRQKAVLWQLTNKSWKPYGNPFDTAVGQQVYDALHAEPEPERSLLG